MTMMNVAAQEAHKPRDFEWCKNNENRKKQEETRKAKKGRRKKQNWDEPN